MPLLDRAIVEHARQELADLAGPVRLVMFTQEFECRYCRETHQLVEEIAQLSDQLTPEIYDFVVDNEKAEELGVDKIPAIAIIGTADYGVRFYGIPSGYEFTAFLQTIRTVASGQSPLAEETLEFLASLDEPVHIQVFVTPTCPYCASSVVLSHQMAVASPAVRADMVEAMEFPELMVRYQVMGVPRTVINDTVHVEGAVPEATVLAKLKEALAGAPESVESG
jgi:glutaredoxin-like protein